MKEEKEKKKRRGRRAVWSLVGGKSSVAPWLPFVRSQRLGGPSTGLRLRLWTARRPGKARPLSAG